MTMLEVFIPTYNRPKEFEKCLRSLENTLLYMASGERACIGIAINDNSTDYLESYEEIIEDFKARYFDLSVSYFDYRRTGFNVGGINNILSGIYSAKADYVWLLPDDDLSRFDSLAIILSVIREFRPSFISGAWINKSTIKYNSDSTGDDDGSINRVLDVKHTREKVSVFFEKNVVQAQEYVYRAPTVKKFLQSKENRRLLNHMFPGLLAIVCLREDAPFVRLERSIGIFRDGDPKSEWRHLWVRLALIEWPQVCEKLLNRGWLSHAEYRLAVGVFRSMFEDLSKRPDILTGLNRKRNVSPFLLFKYHRSYFLNALLRSPFFAPIAIYKKLKEFM